MSKQKDLITITRAISKKYEGISKLTGERFNIFSLLGAETDEVKTHSNFVAELLNPDGLHGLGNQPLERFVDMLKIDFDLDNARVDVEYYIGPVTDTTGGRIDIIVWNDSDKPIIIENKIDAGDQPNQLLRYYNFNPNAHLYYLTKFGNDASELSTAGNKELEEKVINLSYETFILNWMEDCLKLATSVPIVRESIAQYIFVLKKITNQNTNRLMSNEIVDEIIKDGDNLSAFLALTASEKTVLNRITENFKEDLEDTLKDGSYPFELFTDTEWWTKLDGETKYGAIWFENDHMRSLNTRITIQFHQSKLRELWIGYNKILGTKDNHDHRLTSKMQEAIYVDAKEYADWHACAKWPEFYHDTEKVLKAMLSGEFKEKVLEVATDLYSRIEEIKPVEQPSS